MPSQSMEFKVELVNRHSSVPYFAGPGGVTSTDGYTTTPATNFVPDLVKQETRIVFAALFRI